MKFAYADPPYLGKAKTHYGSMHPDAGDYDRPLTHKLLVERLVDEFPDGWALSLNSNSLRVILPWCPEDARVMAWVKPFCSFKPNVNPAYSWEPVIFRGGRKFDRWQDKVKDHHIASITLRAGSFPGAKPESFCFWVFEALNMEPGDELHDIFPGSGAVTQAWREWCGMARVWGIS